MPSFWIVLVGIGALYLLCENAGTPRGAWPVMDPARSTRALGEMFVGAARLYALASIGFYLYPWARQPKLPEPPSHAVALVGWFLRPFDMFHPYIALGACLVASAAAMVFVDDQQRPAKASSHPNLRMIQVMVAIVVGTYLLLHGATTTTWITSLAAAASAFLGHRWMAGRGDVDEERLAGVENLPSVRGGVNRHRAIDAYWEHEHALALEGANTRLLQELVGAKTRFMSMVLPWVGWLYAVEGSGELFVISTSRRIYRVDSCPRCGGLAAYRPGSLSKVHHLGETYVSPHRLLCDPPIMRTWPPLLLSALLFRYPETQSWAFIVPLIVGALGINSAPNRPHFGKRAESPGPAALLVKHLASSVRFLAQ